MANKPSLTKKDPAFDEKPPGKKENSAFYQKHPLLSTAAQSVFEFQYLPKVIKKAVNNLLEVIGGKILNIF